MSDSDTNELSAWTPVNILYPKISSRETNVAKKIMGELAKFIQE